jgi:hypothetical protein
MMHASARSDSIPATRLHFMKILCGYEEAEKEWPFEKSYEREDKKRREGWGPMGDGRQHERFGFGN